MDMRWRMYSYLRRTISPPIFFSRVRTVLRSQKKRDFNLAGLGVRGSAASTPEPRLPALPWPLRPSGRGSGSHSVPCGFRIKSPRGNCGTHIGDVFLIIDTMLSRGTTP